MLSENIRAVFFFQYLLIKFTTYVLFITNQIIVISKLKIILKFTLKKYFTK